MYIISVTKLNFVKDANRFFVKKGWTHDGRKYNQNILVYVEDGECLFRIDEKKYQIKKDEYVIVPENTFYKPYTETYCRYCYFHFIGEYLGEISSTDDLNNTEFSQNNTLDSCFILPETGKTTRKFILHLNSTIEERSYKSTGRKRRMNIAFLNALNCIAYGPNIQDKDALASKIYQYIVENLTGQMNLSDIASHFGYSKQHIINQFKREYGIPPTAFLLKKRLELSVVYLLETSLTINEISSKCGFNDPNYYSRSFREKYKMSPQNYREYYLDTH